MSKEMGIDYSMLHRFEHGKGIDCKNLIKILRWLFDDDK